MCLLHYIKHPQLSGKPPNLFDSDGVHLSELGNNTLLDNIHDALEHLLDCAGVGFLALLHYNTTGLQ